MRYYANLYDVDRPNLDGWINEILVSVSLKDALNTRAEKLSGGMKRRLDFALSIIHNPELLILDEPTTGLDPILVNQFWQAIKAAKKDKTVLLISHIFPEIKDNCDKACILNKGRVSHIIHITKKTDLFKEFSKVAKA
jgi:ABC-2 type transport system ATP-binding protein